ncbi:MAG: fumarylacetoacetate hydrolase family protein [Anaerolineales bacterium]
MYLTKYKTAIGIRWGVDGRFLPSELNLSALLEMRSEPMREALSKAASGEPAAGEGLAPIDPMQEVWAAGVTYLRSREARKAESTVADMYEKVYGAKRPEIFSKSLGWRVVGNGGTIRIRKDSQWNVPEPELTLVINRHGTIVGYCAGNDVSSRDIEGENPLYLPQAKIYNGSCALGHAIWLCAAEEIKEVPIRLAVQRADKTIFEGQANTSMMKRSLAELTDYLTRELDFPQGVFLMTGTCLVPGSDFTLQSGDVVTVEVGASRIENPVE